MKNHSCLILALCSVLSFAIGGCTAEKNASRSKASESAKSIDAVKASLAEKLEPEQQARLERGVEQVAALWRAEDGDLARFVEENFISDPKARQAVFNRLESVLEQVDGHNNEIGRELRLGVDLDRGPMLPVDPMLASIDPNVHVVEDLFRSKAAFVALLNFPVLGLKDKVEQAKSFTRQQWAEARLTDRFARRVPPAISQQIAETAAKADVYISDYNIWMHHVLTASGQRLFPSGMKLISHWGLRDELKAAYADPKNGLEKQRLIHKIMDRIITQTIPAAVVNNAAVDWDPITNTVTAAPENTIEKDAPRKTATPSNEREPDTRYARWLEQFTSGKQADAYSPIAPTVMARTFELGLQLTEERIVGLLTQVLASPVAKDVGAIIQRRLGRPLEPYDIWYNGFKGRSRSAEEITAITQKRYPDGDAFTKDMPRILGEIGFADDAAEFLTSHIRIDPARGAGHAMPALRRGDFPRLRTRIGSKGMDHQGYNTAMHELGHTVEQVISLYKADHTLLADVPNTAFTEAMAFIFQARDLEMLGLSKPDKKSENERVLDTFWSVWEIAGMAMVDIGAWHWLYDHPNATPAEFRDAVVSIAKDLWNKYYAPVLGGKDLPLLAVYSHMISYPLYLPAYPLGHLIEFQLEDYLRTKKKIGPELERMLLVGKITPDLWMENATGAPLSAQPLLDATKAAAAR